MFKVGDRVVHEDKGTATVIYSDGYELLLELDNEVGSNFHKSLANIPLRGYRWKDGYWYWRPSVFLCRLAKREFKGNSK